MTISRAESHLAAALGELLPSLEAGESIEDCQATLDLFTSICFFAPGILAQVHDYWKGRSLDGITRAKLTKRGEHAVEIIGLAWVLGNRRDPSMVPIHVRCHAAADWTCIEGFACRIGIATEDEGSMAGFKNDTRGALLIHQDPEAIRWAFGAEYDEEGDG